MLRAGVSSVTLGLALVLFGQSTWAAPHVSDILIGADAGEPRMT
jgi:hypothetical protein